MKILMPWSKVVLVFDYRLTHWKQSLLQRETACLRKENTFYIRPCKRKFSSVICEDLESK